MLTFGSVCSGIEAAHFAFSPLGYQQVWSSETAKFPSNLLNHYYPDVPNLGDMVGVAELIKSGKVVAPDVFCGGTPCQAFSLAGWKNGLDDDRGLLTMKFIEIADTIDKVRKKLELNSSVILWENVEGVLNDRTNAFGNFIGGLSGHDHEIVTKGKWPKAGFYEGPTRRIAWRVLDSKFFGLPQQRKRLYVVATDKSSHPDRILFDLGNPQNSGDFYNSKNNFADLFSQFEEDNNLCFEKQGVHFEFFRDYTDCLYAAYGTKWNGNAAAYNGSLYVAQNNKLRRLIPEECELLMGFSKGYTDIDGAKHTTRYQAVGNSWAIPVVKWIGERFSLNTSIFSNNWKSMIRTEKLKSGGKYFNLGDVYPLSNGLYLNTSMAPNTPIPGNLYEVAQTNNLDKFYLSAKACRGILRRKEERDLNMNPRLEEIMKMQAEEVYAN